MTVILLNCVTLGMFQPCEDPDCDTPRCQILKVCDDVIYLYFTVEMCIKMLAMGVAGKGCYLSETWNRLDCFIVIAGALEYCLDVEKLNLSAIRTVRVLRPLRAINRIPSMRILVMLLLDTLPMLGNVLLLCFFVFFIFGIIGVQLWAGLLRQRCFIPEERHDYVRNSKFFNSTRKFQHWDSAKARHEDTAYQIVAALGGKKMSSQGLLQEVQALIGDMDDAFLACMCLAEAIPEWTEEDDSGPDESHGNDLSITFQSLVWNHEVLADFFSELATEERKKADLFFRWLYENRTALAVALGEDVRLSQFESDEEENDESDLVAESNGDPMNHFSHQSWQLKADPILSLQWLMRRRADHMAKVLQLKDIAERTKDSNFLHFLRLHQDKLFGCNEESSKRIREVILDLELRKKEKNKNNQFSSWYYQTPELFDKDYICSTADSSGMHKCADLPVFEEDGLECYANINTGLFNSTDCINWNQYFTDCKPGKMNPFHGAISFDNIGLAWVAIFLVISLEGWTDVMYFVQDAHSFWNWVYFVMLIVVSLIGYFGNHSEFKIGSFFMINLCLVVIATQFSETKRRETAKMKAERARFQSSSTLSSFTNSETTNCYRQVIRLIAHLLRKAMSRLRKWYKRHRLEHLKRKEVELMETQDAGQLRNYRVTKNVSTHTVIPVGDGRIEMRIELDDVIICESLAAEAKPICQSEKMTQTDPCLLNRHQFQGRMGRGGVPGTTTPNGTSVCTHPTLTCQELLALSSALSATLTAQIGGFDANQIRRCSTQNLPDGPNGANHGSESGRCEEDDDDDAGDVYELSVTPKTPSKCYSFFGCCLTCLNKLQTQLENFVDHNIFQRFILFCILINTFSMGIEFHKQPELLTKTVEVSNLAFSAIFAVEMALKLGAYGLFRYISDGFNVFDGVIVIFSSMELYTGFVHGINDEGGSTGLSVLRTFRLLRILKLVRFLPNLRRQLVVMLRTMDNVAVFFGLLMLFIFIFSILGMNLFGCKFCDGDVCDRKNFDTLLWATVTVFQVLTQEDWNIVLFLGMQRTSHWAALYFVILMTFGNYVLFNLLVAILVEGFSNQDEKRSSDRNSLYSKDANSGVGHSQSPCHSLPNSTFGGNDDDGQGYNPRLGLSRGNLSNGSSIVKQMSYSQSPRLSKSVIETLRNNVMEMGEPRQLVLPCPSCGETRVVMARQVRKEEVECNPLFAEFLQQSRGISPPNGTMSVRRGSKTTNSMNRRRTSKCCSLAESDCSKCDLENCRLDSNSGFTDLPKAGKNGSNGRANSIHMMENGEGRPRIEFGCQGLWYTLLYWRKSILARWERFKYDRQHFSLWVFKPEHRFREVCQDLTGRSWFDFIVLTFIACNCITLAMERPNIPPWSNERRFLDILNHIFTFVFSIEMLLKAIASGRIWTKLSAAQPHIKAVSLAFPGLLYGEHAYFKSGWNIMDGSLVIISLIDTVMVVVLGQVTKIFGILRVFRLVRALRPLRVINRAPGLKLVVQTLLSSLKPIGNIVLICCTFFIIFGILGVQVQYSVSLKWQRSGVSGAFHLCLQLFKGIFYYCEGPDAHHIKNKTQCLELSGRGNRWINHKYNFDNLGHALMSLFVLSSKDGWVNIMYQGLDAVGMDQQPRENFNEWRLVYFISFLLLVGFFVLNMFVGVVVENFHRCRAEQEKEERARRAAKRAKKIEERRRKMLATPYYIHYSPTRLMIHKMVTSKYFDLAISAVIGLNVITMAMEFYMMPNILAYALKVFNYFFTAVFILEAGMKISALGLGRYLHDRWNQLDVVIVFLSIMGIVLEELKSDLMPINPTIMRVMRVLRIARVLKLLKMAKGIRALLDTVMQALPQVGNLGLLFFLLFFIFAALGVEMFGRLECDDAHPCQGLGEHAHFRSFGMAFLTLFRIATGDNWNGIMKDTLRDECEEGDDCLRNCCVSPYFAPLFFVVFVLMAQFVLVNVVVAVLMKHLEESHKQVQSQECEPPSSQSWVVWPFLGVALGQDHV
eukprot:maker-scaffold300_size216557-snap-gene-0.14 protein:Tk07143 transcript:maker-scaffold300_size216557-snap-gene-0.14-mRNA-1 annotation:"voltage-dependent t-type calcium channel subunit alpha-1g"